MEDDTGKRRSQVEPGSRAHVDRSGAMVISDAGHSHAALRQASRRVSWLRCGPRRHELTRYLGADVGEEQLREVIRFGDRTAVAGTLHPTEIAGWQRPLQQLRAAAQVLR